MVAYVGDGGLSTGPHLYYEVLHTGVRVGPARAANLRVAGRNPAEASAVRARKALIDATVASVLPG